MPVLMRGIQHDARWKNVPWGLTSFCAGAGIMIAATPVVFIVDDDKSFRTSVGRLVEASGWRSAAFESGAEFLARFPTAEPGCVLVDLRMPGLDGLELQACLAKT